MARWCERSAQASISSRLIPAAWAVFHPTVIDMSRVGASGDSTCVGGIHRSSNSRVGPGMRWLISGVIDSDCTPPATMTLLGTGADLCGRIGNRGEATRAMAWVHRLAGHRDHPRVRRRVAGEIAATVMRFGEYYVVDVGHLDPGPPDRFLQDGGSEYLGGRVDQRAFERSPDRGPDSADDDGLGHVVNLRFGCINGQRERRSGNRISYRSADDIGTEQVCLLRSGRAETLVIRTHQQGGADALPSARVLRRGCAGAALRPGGRTMLRLATASPPSASGWCGPNGYSPSMTLSMPRCAVRSGITGILRLGAVPTASTTASLVLSAFLAPITHW